jgi:hypothetical protein
MAPINSNRSSPACAEPLTDEERPETKPPISRFERLLSHFDRVTKKFTVHTPLGRVWVSILKIPNSLTILAFDARSRLRWHRICACCESTQGLRSQGNQPCGGRIGENTEEQGRFSMRKRAHHTRSKRTATLVAITLIVAWELIIIPGLGHTKSQTAQMAQDTAPLLQRSTVAVCGAPTCDCGALRLVSKTQGPCEATAVAGGCRQGSGMCCVCEGRHSVVVCGEDSCTCGATQVPVQVDAPCEVVSPAGSCRIGSGVCCVCVTP